MQLNTFMEKTIQKYGANQLYKFVLNEKNRMITKDFIKNMLNNFNIKYQPKDITLFEVSMTHISYVSSDLTNIENFKQIFTINNVLINETLVPILDESLAIKLQNASYERLEFLGDSILKQIITDYIFFRYETMGSGELTKLRACLENRLAFSTITRKLNLNKYVLLNRNFENQHYREINNKLLCDIFESFIGALYLDISGISYNDIGNVYDIVKKDRSIAHQIIHNFVIELLEDATSGPDLCQILEIDTNYIAKLQEQFQQLGWNRPEYFVMEIIDDKEKNKKYFKIGVYDNNKIIIGTGTSSSKKNAKQLVAKNALDYLDNLNKNVIK